MTISITNNQSALPISEPKIKRRLGRILKELKKSEFNLSVLFCDDEEIRRLNREFRKVDRPTNVLAFPDAQGVLGQASYLGDLALSTETVIREADEFDWPAGERLYFYLIHGLLHLLGYDHELGPAEAKAQEDRAEGLIGLIKRDL
jgi:rRNA maturation RNase YbeY